MKRRAEKPNAKTSVLTLDLVNQINRLVDSANNNALVAAAAVCPNESRDFLTDAERDALVQIMDEISECVIDIKGLLEKAWEPQNP